MWNRLHGLSPESRRGIGGSVQRPFPDRGPDGGKLTSNKNRSWSWAQFAAKAALFQHGYSGKKREGFEDLFAKPPGVGVHGVSDPRSDGLIDGFRVD